jgi:hypothetical protein
VFMCICIYVKLQFYPWIGSYKPWTYDPPPTYRTLWSNNTYIGYDTDTNTLTSIIIWKNDIIQYNYKCQCRVDVQHRHKSDAKICLIQKMSVFHTQPHDYITHIVIGIQNIYLTLKSTIWLNKAFSVFEIVSVVLYIFSQCWNCKCWII